jgi:hypothetical protein
MQRAVLVVLLCACGSDANPGGSVDAPPGGGGGDGGGGGGGDGGGGGGGDGGGGGGWQSLVSGDWTLPAGDEGYVCVRRTLPETIYVTAFRPLIPQGTHHTVLTVGGPNGADGTFPCGVGTNSDRMIFGSGVGTDDFYMPDGVAVRLEAGEQLNLNLHLYNYNDSAPISGTSGTEVQVVPAAEVEHEAEVILAGPVGFTLDASAMDRIIEGTCTMNASVTLFATGPHMHQVGKHMRVWANGTMIMDRAYSFDEQTAELIEPIALTSGQQVRVECTYQPGPANMWGDSSDQEMCFASLFRYPAQGSAFGYICPY